MCATAASVQAPAKLKVGLMLPYTGIYASLGTAIENGFKQYVAERGNKLGGREIEFVKVDDASDPSKATDNVDVLIGSVHSGVAMLWPRSSRTMPAPKAFRWTVSASGPTAGLKRRRRWPADPAARCTMPMHWARRATMPSA